MPQLCARSGQLRLGELTVHGFPVRDHIVHAPGDEPPTCGIGQPRGHVLLVCHSGVTNRRREP